jgi:lysyl endopeptidase
MKPTSIRKFAFLCLTSIVALGVMGMSFALSSSEMTVSPTCCCGNAAFVWAVSNDPVSPPTSDPRETGSWTVSGSSATWHGTRFTYNVASTNAILSGDKQSINVMAQNAYPGYCPSVCFAVRNSQGYPLKISRLTLTPVFPANEIQVSLLGIAPGQLIAAGATVTGSLNIMVNDTAKPGQVYSFTAAIELQQACNKPSAPVLKSPLCGSVLNSLTPRPEWFAVPDAVSYSIQVSTDPGFNNLIFNQSNITGLSTGIPSGKLQKKKTYYWQVKAVNSYGSSDWSLAWWFSTPK